MQLLDLRWYLDGGTWEFDTTEGLFIMDKRIGSKTQGHIFDGMPHSGKPVKDISSPEVYDKLISMLAFEAHNAVKERNKKDETK